MYKNYPYLSDNIFLNKVFLKKNISHFVKVTTLNWNEQPLQQVQGQVITGIFNVNGKSSVRRTGNITFIANNFNILTDINSIFSINKKIFLEIGIKNNFNEYLDYPIIWFPMGLYVIVGASCNHSLEGLNIILQLKDKMCLLNGECGGVIPAATTFSIVETIDKDGNVVQSFPTMFQIIQELVNHFGKQDLSRIFISDLDLQVKQVMKWMGSTPLYISNKKNQQNQFRITTDYSKYVQSFTQGFVAVDGSPFSYGKDIGYIYTDFTYPGQLVCDAGATVTSILDKIVSVLINYEYFYDVYGNFIFRQIKNYLNNSQTKDLIKSIKENGGFDLSDYIIDLNHSKAVYSFENSDLVTSYSNTPQYGMIKNDFVIWGVRKNATGNISSLVRYHLAIDKKPKIGNTYKVFQYKDPYDGILKWHCPIKYSNKNNFPKIGAEGVYYYDENQQKIYTWEDGEYIQINAVLQQVTTKDWRTQLYFQGVAAEPFGTESNDYYSELKNEWPKIYNILPDENGTNNSGFKEQIFTDPISIDYFLDFIDSDNLKMQAISVDQIGRRSYSLQSEELNCVFEPSIPDVILINLGDPNLNKIREECDRKNQVYYQIEESIYDVILPGGVFNSCYEYVRQSLHQYTNYNENVSISCIPLYFLQPNTRIYLRDDVSGIQGDFIINSFSFGLKAGDLMSINATKALERV